MLEEEFIKPERAAERLEQVLDIDPNNETALRGLERLYRNMQRWDELIGAYERHVNATPDRSENDSAAVTSASTQIQKIALRL